MRSGRLSRADFRRGAGWAVREKWICARFCKRFFTFCRLAANGAPCQRIFRLTRQSKVIFTRGAILGGGKRSSQLWFGKPAGNSGENPDQRWRLSTAKVHRQPTPAVREAMMLANVSTGEKGTLSP